MIDTTGMQEKEVSLTKQLIKAERTVRRLRKEYAILLMLKEREAELRKIAEEERKKKEVELDQVVGAIANAVDAKDEETNGHSVRVAAYSVKIAESMGLGQNIVDHVYQAALLHDVGKVGVPDTVLKKNGKLTEEEFEIIRSHTTVGKEILSAIKSVPYITEGSYYHHERWDGKGYPQGLKGEEIPLMGRIIAVADVYDALVSKRCYKESMSKQSVVEEIVKGSGTQFDPKIVQAFLKCIGEGDDDII